MSTTDLRKNLLTQIESRIQGLAVPEKPVSLYKPYIYAMGVKGKRIRPLLCLLGAGLCGGDTDEALPAAMALEILHNFTLVHDDIMDSAETRRGEDSVYHKWDENIAILTGDVMFADAYRQLSFYGQAGDFSKSDYAEINRSFSEAVITVCEGQALDMEFVHRDDVSHEEYIHMISGKTGALLGASLELGALSARAGAEKPQSLYEMGMELGIAFQVQDDLLDATADPEKFGKRPGGDIYEGKKTYLTILALERATDEQNRFIRQVLDAASPTASEVEEVLQLLHTLNVIEDVRTEVDEHYDKAAAHLSTFEDSPYKQELVNLLTFLKNRDH